MFFSLKTSKSLHQELNDWINLTKKSKQIKKMLQFLVQTHRLESSF